MDLSLDGKFVKVKIARIDLFLFQNESSSNFLQPPITDDNSRLVLVLCQNHIKGIILYIDAIKINRDSPTI